MSKDQICPLCKDGYVKFILPNGDVRHEALGLSWTCLDFQRMLREAQEDKLRDNIANGHP